MANVTVTLSGDGSKLAAVLQQAIEMEKKFGNAAENATNQASRGAGVVNDSMGKLMKTLQAVGTAVVTAFGVRQVVQVAINAIREYDDALGKLADKQKTLVDAKAAYAALQEPRMEEKALRDAENLGARYNVKPRDSYIIAEEMQSIASRDEYTPEQNRQRGLKYAESAMKLVKIGVDAETAKDVISYGNSAGVTPDRIVDIAYEAAQRSRLTPAKFTKAMPSLVGYNQSVSAGLAAFAAISKNRDEGEVETIAMRTALAIKDKNDLTKRIHLDKKVEDWMAMSEQQGIEADPIMTRLAFIREAVQPDPRTGLYDEAIFKKAGVPDIREQKGLTDIMNNWDKFTEDYWAIKNTPVGRVEDLTARLEKVPEIGSAWADMRHDAEAEAAQQSGPIAEKSRKHRQEQIAIANKYGNDPKWVDQETHMPFWRTRILNAIREPNAESDDIVSKAIASTLINTSASIFLRNLVPGELLANIMRGGQNTMLTPAPQTPQNTIAPAVGQSAQPMSDIAQRANWFSGPSVPEIKVDTVDLVSALKENTAAAREMTSHLKINAGSTPRPVPRINPQSGIE